MSLDLYAGVCVSDYGGAKGWYESFVGDAPCWEHPGHQAVWRLADHRHIAIEADQQRAGQSLHLVLVPDFVEVVDRIRTRGLEPVKRELYSTGVRIAAYRDPDGNEIRIGGLVLSAADC